MGAGAAEYGSMSAATRRAYFFGLAAEPLFMAIIWPDHVWTAKWLLLYGLFLAVFVVLLELLFAGVGYVRRHAQRSTAP
jgi:hypothetical protein